MSFKGSTKARDILMDIPFMNGVYQTLIELDDAYKNIVKALAKNGHRLDAREQMLARKTLAQVRMLHDNIHHEIKHLRKEFHSNG